jgi:hypothetical protein
MVRTKQEEEGEEVGMKVMQDQTDDERRQLRQGYRDLSKKISEQGEEMEDPDTHVFDRVREENNELFKRVRFTREAVLDGDNMEAISTRASRQVDRLVQVGFLLIFLAGLIQPIVKNTHTKRRLYTL